MGNNLKKKHRSKEESIGLSPDYKEMGIDLLLEGVEEKEEKMAINSLDPDQPSRLSTQPDDLLNEISSFLPLDDKIRANLAGSCHRLNSFFQPSVTEERRKRVCKLLQHVVYGELNEVKAILEENSALLLYRDTVMDYSGREIEGTALQMALGAEDIEMAEMIKGYLIHREDGKAEIQRQQAEQFPEGEEKEWEARQDNDREALKKITEAILAANVSADNNLNLTTDEACQLKLANFRDYLKPAGVVIRTGRHFNANLLLEAFKLYARHYNDFGGQWNSPKNMLFWRQVIGCIQRGCPANYAQAFCRGLYPHVQRRDKLQRSLKFNYDLSTSYFPLSPDSGLGFDFAVAACIATQLAVSHAAAPAGHFQSLCQAKTADLQEIMLPRGRDSSWACVIL